MDRFADVREVNNGAIFQVMDNFADWMDKGDMSLVQRIAETVKQAFETAYTWSTDRIEQFTNEVKQRFDDFTNYLGDTYGRPIKRVGREIAGIARAVKNVISNDPHAIAASAKYGAYLTIAAAAIGHFGENWISRTADLGSSFFWAGVRLSVGRAYLSSVGSWGNNEGWLGSPMRTMRKMTHFTPEYSVARKTAISLMNQGKAAINITGVLFASSLALGLGSWVSGVPLANYNFVNFVLPPSPMPNGAYYLPSLSPIMGFGWATASSVALFVLNFQSTFRVRKQVMNMRMLPVDLDKQIPMVDRFVKVIDAGVGNFSIPYNDIQAIKSAKQAPDAVQDPELVGLRTAYEAAKTLSTQRKTALDTANTVVTKLIAKVDAKHRAIQGDDDVAGIAAHARKEQELAAARVLAEQATQARTQAAASATIANEAVENRLREIERNAPTAGRATTQADDLKAEMIWSVAVLAASYHIESMDYESVIALFGDDKRRLPEKQFHLAYELMNGDVETAGEKWKEGLFKKGLESQIISDDFNTDYTRSLKEPSAQVKRVIGNLADMIRDAHRDDILRAIDWVTN